MTLPLAEGRYEVKAVAAEAAEPGLERWLLGHPAGFAVAHPPRWVNNIYFDSPDLAAYAENLAGIARRTKVRLRWYDNQAAAAQLELKLRRGVLGWKRVYPLTGCDPLALGWPALGREITRRLPPEALPIAAANPLPVLLNRYHRRYYVSADRAIRVTLDRAQEAYDQRLTPGPRRAFRAPLPDYLVMELKFAADESQRAREILADGPLRIGRSSKYVLGVKAILGAG